MQDEDILKTNCKDEEGRLERIKSLKEELKNEIDEITIKIEEMSNLGFESQKRNRNAKFRHKCSKYQNYK